MHALSVSLLRAKQLPVITNGLGASPHAGSTCTIGVVTVRPLNRLPARLYFKLKPDPNNTFFFIFTCTTQYPWVLANLNLSQAMAPSKKKRTHTVFRDSSAYRSASTSKPRFVGEKQPLENRVDYVRGVTYKAAVDLHEELDDSSYVLLRANNIQDGELRFDDVQYVDRAKVKQKQLLRRGDILFCASSGSKGLVGKAALVRENMPVTFGAFCCVLRPKENEAEYLAHYFQSQQYRRAIEKVCSGSNINNLKAANFFSLVVPHYDDDSTHVISALFDSIDAQIKHAKDQIANLDSLVKSRFVEMFGELDTNPKGFQLTCFDDLGTWTSGGTPSRKNPSYFTGEIDWYSAGELNSLHLGRSKERISLRAVEESSAKLVPPGSLFVGMYDTAALKMGITTKESSSNQACANLVPNGIVDLVWLYFAIDQLKPSLLAKRSGCRQKNLSLKKIKSFMVLLPDLDSQQGFSRFVAQVDKSRLFGIMR